MPSAISDSRGGRGFPSTKHAFLAVIGADIVTITTVNSTSTVRDLFIVVLLIECACE